ncbi:MAG: PCMD domain-containing protein [Tannerellaceae bacterium]|nr:PCMD domain-containing protein [Tannerellaceae bacterium]
MKQYKVYMRLFLCCIFSIILLSSCSEDNLHTSEQEAQVYINIQTDKSVLTKSDTEKVIFRVEPIENGAIEEYSLITGTEHSIDLVVGSYRFKAIVGEDPNGKPSFVPYYVAYSDIITLSSGEVKNLNMVCKLTTVVIEVDYSGIESLYEGYDYETIVSTESGDKITFSKSENGKNGYFGEGSLTVVFRYGNNGSWQEKELADITNTVPQYKYIITYSINNGSGEENGAAGVGVNIIDKEDKGEKEIQITLPKIEYSLDEVVDANIGDIYAVITGEASLNNGSMIDEVYFEYTSSKNEINSPVQANFQNGKWTATLENLSPATTYKVWFKDKEETAKEFTTKPVTLEASAWSTFAILSGTYSKTGGNIMFEYKSSVSPGWSNQIPATIDENGFYSASIKGLTPNTAYEYRLVSISGMKGNVVTFTTEEERQLPNAGFESWSRASEGSTTWTVIYDQSEDKFWDSGNKGAASAGKTVTNYSTSNIKSGSYSAELNSLFAGYVIIVPIGRFAAGNLFAGEYVETLMGLNISTAGGKLSFGREFTSRPTKLKGWYKYDVGTIDYVDSSIPADLVAEGAKKGEPDKAHIYFALSDKGEPYTIINTTAQNNTITLFDKNDENIIAYGEFIKPESTDGLEEFEVELEYNSLTRKPTHIIIVCSASKYGDYFTGSTGSTLWLDDFELVYGDEPKVK